MKKLLISILIALLLILSIFIAINGLNVGKIEVFKTDSVAEISHKIYTIIGIVMLFVFAYLLATDQLYHQVKLAYYLYNP